MFAVATMPAHARAAEVLGAQSSCIQRSSAAAVNAAGLSVTFPSGEVTTFCIEFSEDTITGAELLQRSGLAVVTAGSGGLGAAVCSIDGQGCNDPGDCFCACTSSTCAYWAYFRYNSGAWQYSPTGAGTRTIANGDADAWVWGSGSTPPPASGALCADPTPTPSPLPSSTPKPSATPRPSSTPVTPQSSPTAAATSTPTSTSSPIPTPPVQAVVPTTAPTSAVLAAGRTLPATTPTTTTPRPGPTDAASATLSPRSGAIRISDEEGERNLAGNQNGGNWRWRSTVMFAGIAAMLVCVGGALLWRRRAGI
jgi:hypothetical protein